MIVTNKNFPQQAPKAKTDAGTAPQALDMAAAGRAAADFLDENPDILGGDWDGIDEAES